MDLEEFYEADERRRSSVEVEVGRDWRDANGVRYELSWVADTGELYVMREPEPSGSIIDPWGDWVSSSLPDEALTVEVLGYLPTREDMETVLGGWEHAMTGHNSITWVMEALHRAGVRPAGAPAPPPDQ
ncbi:MAG TPA: hypothetical protein VE152_14330 [Acidimicrobiales bacterium]|jgi:hypothetical protein|nr:hypothetical protein [Acidimicrobiales bacterium]